MLSRGNCWLSVEGIPEPIPLTGGDCFLLARGTSIVLRDSPRTVRGGTEWRMQKAIQLLQQRDKKLIDVARSVGYESDAAFSKAFKRVVGANPGEYLKRGI
jgi:AraC-like DNA-binding protein